MNQTCEIVRDLLWMYEEGECSEGTRHYVEEHLLNCEECRNYRKTLQLPEPAVPVSQDKEPQILKKSFRKIRRRWVVSLIIVVMLIPLMGVGKLGYNEYRKEGLCFSNLTDVYQCIRLTRYLEDGDYEKAVQMIHFEEDYEELHEAEATIGETYYDHAILVELPGDGTWAVKPYWAERHGITKEGELLDPYTRENFWFGILYNEYSEMLIPERVWDALVEEYYTEEYMGIQECYYPTKIMGETLDWSREFFRIETQWGIYYTDSMEFCFEEATAKDLVYSCGMVPEAVYEDAREDIEQENEQSQQSFYEYYAEELAMTEEEYIEMRQQECLAAFESYQRQGYSLDYRGIGDIYRVGDGWSVTLNITVTGAENPNTTASYTVEDGKISYCSITDEIR